MSYVMDIEKCSPEIKDLYQSVYTIVKQLDEQKKKLTSISQLFDPDINKKRLNLIKKCRELLFKDHQVIGKKSREFLWRKGYYEYIAFIKRNLSKEKNENKSIDWMDKLRLFLLEGITNYKWIVIKLERVYDLDLQYLIDFSIIKNEDFEKNGQLNGITVQKSLEVVGFALDTIHSSLLSLGDLHRYYLEFKFNEKSSLNITRELTARYYYQAFQLNSTIGMAQNQIGTLYQNENYDLDSIYHYLYSLICTIPFELSETNVCRLFVSHSDYLECLDPNKIEFSLRDFYARFYLIIDIFFFDKNVPDFNSLCHCVLIDLRKVLYSKSINISEASIFKIVSILLFCLSKLKMIKSDKVYSLNAFLVAVCSDLIDSCTTNLEQFVSSRTKQNEKFEENYLHEFNEFEKNVRKSREEYKTFYNKKTNFNKSVLILNNMKNNTNNTLNGTSLPKNDDSNSKSTSNVDKQSSSPSSQCNDIKYDNISYLKETKCIDNNSQTKSTNSEKSMNTKRKQIKLRRRRRRVAQSGDDGNELSSIDDSDSELDTDFSSNDSCADSDEEDSDDYTDEDDGYNDSDLNSNFDSDSDDIHEDHNKQIKKINNENSNIENKQQQDQQLYRTSFSDNEDMVIEEEEIIYPNDAENQSKDFIENFNGLSILNNDLHFKSENEEEKSKKHDVVNKENIDKKVPPIKLKYKNKYSKVDPNIIIEFTKNEVTMRSLKILFDWLLINNEILIGCYHTNPEFIHKIIKLLNYCNIDIFTKKVFFKKEFIKVGDMRENLDGLFEIRSTIPLFEDISLKGFDLLNHTQSTLDWEIPLREKISENEENILRIFKMIDFGFFICKLRKFNYNFCSKGRRFTENIKRDRRNKKKIGAEMSLSTRDRKRNDRIMMKSRNNNVRNGSSRNQNEKRKNKFERRRNYSSSSSGLSKGYNRKQDEVSHRDYQERRENDSNIKNNSDILIAPKKGYLRNRNQNITKNSKILANTNSNHTDNDDKQNEQKNDLEQKCRLMGKLWLKSEVENLENKLKQKPINVILTPFIVVDAKALTEFTEIVKLLVKSKQFIVLIPTAVLSELDHLKKESDRARITIRWLEQEFKVGNRYMRGQRDHESRPLPLIKIPKKLDRESSLFVQIAKFCNFIVVNHSDETEFKANLITYLSGDYLNDKKSTNLNFTGILDAIPVRHDQILNFYEKFKNE